MAVNVVNGIETASTPPRYLYLVQIATILGDNCFFSLII